VRRRAVPVSRGKNVPCNRRRRVTFKVKAIRYHLRTPTGRGARPYPSRPDWSDRIVALRRHVTRRSPSYRGRPNARGWARSTVVFATRTRAVITITIIVKMIIDSRVHCCPRKREKIYIYIHIHITNVSLATNVGRTRRNTSTTRGAKKIRRSGLLKSCSFRV
jgi:hypothetical protein